MGVGRWPGIAARLLAGGLPPDTPAAAVRWGTRPEQRTTRATLATLADHDAGGARRSSSSARWPAPRTSTGSSAGRCSGAPSSSPGPAAQASALAGPPASRWAPTSVEAAGHRRSSDAGRRRRWPCGPRPVRPACGRATTGWCSPRPTASSGSSTEVPDARALGGVQVAAIGPGTADALRRAAQVVADLVPERFVAESLLDAFPAAAGDRRRPGAAGPGRGGPRRAARRPAGRAAGTSTSSTPTGP